MLPELPILTTLIAWLRDRYTAIRENPDAGYSTETVIVTALLVTAAITVIGIITAKVIAKANSITL